MEPITMEHQSEGNNGRFVAYYQGEEAGYIKYQYLADGNINANGTLVYENFRDKHLGKPLLDALMNFAREKGIKIYPTCPFVVKSMQRDATLHPLLTDAYKQEHDMA
jgi:predicted GNAT family acetyltransferase